MAKKKGIRVLDLKDINKKYGTCGKASTIFVENDKSLRLPSRCLWLNYQTGGGLPYGKVVEIFGYESTGKSVLALDFAYSCQQLGGEVIWDDAEQCFQQEWAEKNGLDMSKIYLYESNKINGASDWFRDMIIHLRAKLVNNEPILLVVDSIAALESDDNIGMDFVDKKAKYGNRAKDIYEMYRTRAEIFSRYGVIPIMINQVRKKMGATMFENAETQPGGEATKFYAAIRLAINRGAQIKGRMVKGVFTEDKQKGHKIGQNVYVRVEKNKTAPPRPSVKTQVYFLDEMTGYVGYSKYEGLADILIENKIIKKQGNAFYIKSKKKGDIKIASKYDNITQGIATNDLARKLIIQRMGINTISQTQAKLDSLTKNLFPVKLKAKTQEDEDSNS